MCAFNWAWQNFIRPEVTIPLGKISGRLDHMEDLHQRQNTILADQSDELKEHTDQLKLLVQGQIYSPV